MLILILIGTVQFGRVCKKLLVKEGNYSPGYIARRIGYKIRRLLGMEKMGKTASSGNMSGTTIMFGKDEKQHCYEINGRSVTVVGNAGKHDHGSSKLKLRSIVDYKWEQRNYPGRLIACHSEGKLIAYAITVNHRATPEGMVRIVHMTLGQRALIKGMSGEVLDLQFAHISSKILLGIIERIALHVYKVEIVNEKIVCSLLVKVNDPIDDHIPLCDKIAWCPYLQDNSYEDDYASQLLVWTRGDIFQCYSISTVVQHYGAGEYAGKDISEGGFKFRDTLPLITGAIFSADGTTLAVSCEDGVIRFYQVYQHTNDNNPRCLHQWKPHGGKTISSFFFLDNYTDQGGDQTLWKHAITCAENNTEIKVWCCETWECTQTIKFVPSIDHPLCFKAEIDRTSSYLVLSDMATRELFVLQVRKEACRPGNGTGPYITNGKSSEESYICSKLEEAKLGEQNTTSASTVSSTTTSIPSLTRAFISSIAEFPLSSPILSFGILDVAVRMCKTSDAYLIEELDDYDEENNAVYCVVIKMFLVQPKSCQECHLFYQPNVSLGTDVRSTLSSISSEYRNMSHSSSGSTGGNNATSLVDIINQSGISAAASAPVEQSLNSIIAENSIAKVNDSSELVRILSPIVNAGSVAAGATSAMGDGVLGSGSIVSLANTSGSTNSGQPKQHINLMTPDSFNSTSEKTDKNKHDDTVNPDVLNTLFMLANVTKQQQQQHQQQQLITSGTSPNDSLKDKPSPLNMLNIVNSTMIEEQEQAKVRKSVELQQKALLETPPVPPMPSAEMLASGGSSPSREVQEILSLKDNDCLNEYYDSDNILLDETDGIGADDDELNDLENEIIDDEEEDDGYNFKNIDDDDDDDEIQQRRVQPKQTAKPIQKVPELKPNNKEQPIGFVKPEQSREKVIKTESSSSIDWPKVPEVPHPPQPSFVPKVQPPPPQPPMIINMPQNTKQLDEITQKMDRLFHIVQAQSQQLTDIRSQLVDLHKTQGNDFEHHKNLIAGYEVTTAKKIEDILNRFDRAQITKFDQMMTIQSRKNNEEFVRQVMTKLSDYILIQVPARITPNILRDLTVHVIPALLSKVEQLMQIYRIEVQNKLQSSDVALRTGIEQTVRSPAFIETITSSTQAAVRKAMEKAYHESLRTIILPGYERSSQELFRQLNLTFSTGTNEYVQKLDHYLAQQKQVTDRTGELIDLVKKVPEQVNTSSDRQYKESTTILREDINKDFKLLQSNLLKVIRENVRLEIEKGLEAQASSLEDSVLSAVRSQAQTPAPSNVDIQEHIRQLLNSGQTNKAFHKALVSNDLSLVEYTLETADYNQVFIPCSLEQTVLLSLIQQISADMPNHNERKHRYLSDSIVSLNFRNPITKEHAPKVMRELTQNCETYLIANPETPLATNIKMLLIAIQGLGFKQY